jgi:LuxR family maltose regulon positive regulatory protein
MPRPSLHALIWCEDSQQYELRSDGNPEQWFRQGDEPAFACWLAEHSAFSFVGRAGRLSVRKEGRGSGRGYWYAYRKQDGRIRKGYLGPSAQVTFASLEELARSLASSQTTPPLAHDPATQPSRPPIPQLATRLAPPRLPLWLVERTRLLRDLDAVRTHPLTLVSASAGGGKTTLLSAWVTATRQQASGAKAPQAKIAVAWLSLRAIASKFGGGDRIKVKKSERLGWKKRKPLI